MATGEFFIDNFKITHPSIAPSSLSSNIMILLLLCPQAMPNTAVCIFFVVHNISVDIFRKKEIIPTLTTLLFWVPAAVF